VTFSVDGRRVSEQAVRHRLVVLSVPLGRRGWHLVSLDTPRLAREHGRDVGARLVAYSRS
jgi:hypothetical protein